jgi:hypothetical protein
MRNQHFTLAYGVVLMLGIAAPAVAQDNGAQQPSARQQLQVHTPQSIDQELARLTKDLELTPEQQRQVRPLLHEHHDRIQTPLDKNPKASRQELGPQIHAISDETHRKILQNAGLLRAICAPYPLNAGVYHRMPPEAERGANAGKHG